MLLLLCCLWCCCARVSKGPLTDCVFFLSFSRYIPPLLWGKSGHLQTALYGKLGRVSSPHPSGVRKYLPMQDGATSTFDLFEPIGDHQTGGDHCALLWLFVLTSCVSIDPRIAQDLKLLTPGLVRKLKFAIFKPGLLILMHLH